MTRGRPAAFLDRDGTINAPVPPPGYVIRPVDLQLLSGAAEAIRRLNEAGWVVLVITNQRGVALGLCSEAELDAIHARLVELLAAEGAHVDGVYACVHDEGCCGCRKPRPGLVEQALADHPEVELTASVVIGDDPRDLELAAAVGVPGMLVGGCGAGAMDLEGAVTRLLGPAGSCQAAGASG